MRPYLSTGVVKRVNPMTDWVERCTNGVGNASAITSGVGLRPVQLSFLVVSCTLAPPVGVRAPT